MIGSGVALVIAGGIIAFALVSGSTRLPVPPVPLTFTLFGFVTGWIGADFLTIEPESPAVHLLAEGTLVVLLFSDAARIDSRRLRAEHALPLRMLLVGLPLSIAIGTVIALWLPLGLSLTEAALLAALLAPTDVALGKAVVDDSRTPKRLRQAISVESGLNDGLAVPFVLLCAGMLGAGSADALGGAPPLETLSVLASRQIGLGVVVGVVLGWSGASLIKSTAANGRMHEGFEGPAIIALIVALFAAADVLGGNGLVAAFCGGLAYGYRTGGHCEFVLDFVESGGRLMTLVIFFVFGAALLPLLSTGTSWSMLAFALLSLTFIRMAGIALSLLGADVRVGEVLFLGWFGPRGLASILFVLLVAEEFGLALDHPVLLTTLLTVALSVLLHGVSAAPLAKRVRRWIPVPSNGGAPRSDR